MNASQVRSFALELLTSDCKVRAGPSESGAPKCADLPAPMPMEVSEWISSIVGVELPDARLYGIGGPDPWLDMRSIMAVFPHWSESRWYPLADDYFGGYYVLCDKPRVQGRAAILFVNGSYSDEVPAGYFASDIWMFVCRLLTQSGNLKIPNWFRQAVDEDDRILKQFAEVNPLPET